MKKATETVITVAIAFWLILTYADGAMPGHDGMIEGAHFYPHHLGDLALLVIGGLGFWFGMVVLTGRR